jgi:plastocyanin
VELLRAAARSAYLVRQMRNRGVPAAIIAALVAFTVGTGPGRAGVDAAATKDLPSKERILVNDNYFEPRSTEIAEDGVVTWKWHGENRHSIRFTKVPDGAGRKGASIRGTGKWKKTFHRPGVYRYVCKVWSGMRGSVTVRKQPLPDQ